MRNILILVLLLVFVGCKSISKTVTESKEKVETFKITETAKIDTTIFVPAEKVSLFIPISKTIDDKGKFKPQTLKQVQRSGRAKVTVIIDSLGIQAIADCDSIAQRIQFWKQQVKELRLEVKDTKITKKEKQGYSRLELILYIIATAVVSFAAAYLLKTLKIL